MALFDLNRAGDTPIATLKLSPIVPVNWHRFPPRIAASTPVDVPVVSYVGGAFGDDVSVATANATNDYAPRTQAAKATQLGTTLATDVTSPRGWIDPGEKYGPPPVSPTDDPTITSLAPNTIAVGQPPLLVVVTGTKFTQWSTVETGGVPSPYAKYVSPTKMTILLDPIRSVAGTIVVKVVDHGVKSNGSNFVFT